jgi:hypothetical protein
MVVVEGQLQSPQVCEPGGKHMSQGCARLVTGESAVLSLGIGDGPVTDASAAGLCEQYSLGHAILAVPLPWGECPLGWKLCEPCLSVRGALVRHA